MEKFGLPLAGIVQAERPMPIERVLSSACWAAATTSSSVPPSAARAEPTFHIRISPATPRRFCGSVGEAEATSSLATTVLTAMPSLAASLTAIFTFMLSPA